MVVGNVFLVKMDQATVLRYGNTLALLNERFPASPASLWIGSHSYFIRLMIMFAKKSLCLMINQGI